MPGKHVKKSKPLQTLLIKNALLLDAASPFHGQKVSLLIRDGRIARIAFTLEVPDGAKVIEGKSLCVSPGWMDVGAQSGDPGYEWREDLKSLQAAAAAGGYTAVAIAPNTNPCLDTKAALRYVQDRAQAGGVEVLPLAAVSRDTAGREITEFMDMHHAGAVAFTDGSRPIVHSGLMRLALLYVKAFDGLVLNRPFDVQLSPAGQIHESALSASLGIAGIPALAEELMLQRDLYLAEYTGSRLHLSDLSTAGSVELVRKAKARGLRVTASVMAPHLCFTEEAIRDFDVNYKLSPPLRSEEDRQALLAGILDGTIDFISSGHTPVEEEAKRCAFSEAAFGMAGITTTFSMLNTFVGNSLSANVLADKLAIGPRRVLGLPIPHLAEGLPAQLTVFDTDEKQFFHPEAWPSKSKNNPFLNTELQGKVWALTLENG